MRFALRDVEAGRVQPVISEATVRRQYQRIFSVAVAALGAILAANLIAESDSLYRPAPGILLATITGTLAILGGRVRRHRWLPILICHVLAVVGLVTLLAYLAAARSHPG